MPAALQR
jgi:hypothetical protein